MAEFTTACWICGGESLRISHGLNESTLTASHFQVTDKTYGQILDLYGCSVCGFEFCPTAGDPTTHYAALADADYLSTQPQRILQARQILQQLTKHRTVRNLLDVGAGAGNVLAAAQQMRIDTVGIEPCRAFAAAAQAEGLAVVCGVLPHPEITAHYDAVTLVDVLEHVSDPKALLRQCWERVAPNGALLFITPDRRSLMARLLGKRWWHRRVAHIGYFSRRNIEHMLRDIQITSYRFSRPRWVFSLAYLIACLAAYLPGKPSLHLPFGKNILIKLNFYDSWCVIATKQG